MPGKKAPKKKAKKPSARRARPRRKPRRPAVRRTTGQSRAVEVALAAFAHDIRTPLTGILALGELLAASDLGERERAWAQSVKSSAEYLAQLATLAVDSAKAGTKGLALRRETFSLSQLIDAVSAALAARAQTRGLTNKVDVKGELPDNVVGDAVRLRAALENLIDNAVKFTESGSVTLTASSSRAPRGRIKLTFTVTDSGVGMTPAEIKRLFHPFTQANRDVAQRFGGAGLGLVLVKRVARAMGGDLTVTSVAGRGSSFNLSAVVQPAPSRGGQDAESLDPVRRTPARRLRGLRILCVEDNPYGRVILNTILTELGHRADFAGSGEAAVEAVRNGLYDVVMMDITLSGIDGLEAARRIRARPHTFGRVPIIGVSGRSESGDEERARDAGMNGYLTKPLSPSALTRVLADVVR